MPYIFRNYAYSTICPFNTTFILRSLTDLYNNLYDQILLYAFIKDSTVVKFNKTFISLQIKIVIKVVIYSTIFRCNKDFIII